MAALTTSREAEGSSVLHRYLRRHGVAWPVHWPVGVAEVALVVVIPAFDEPELGRTLESLAACDSPEGGWLPLVVVNDRVTDAPEQRARNRKTLELLKSRADVAWIDATGLADDAGGVGQARKIGMDAVLARWAEQGVVDGILASLDADCLVNRGYLRAIVRYFADHPKSPACVTAFRHRLEEAEDARARTAITLYECHLRHFVAGLKRAGVPYAFHTIGSCFACRAVDYARQGGMNRRSAGEDFYFLHKMARFGTVGECPEAEVYPSPRIGGRTPFGTGRALADWLARGGEEWPSYHPAAFDELAVLARVIDDLYRAAPVALPPALAAFFSQQDAERKLAEIRCNTATPEAFRKRFWHWFDGFLAMKFVRFACNTRYGWLPVTEVSLPLLQEIRRAR